MTGFAPCPAPDACVALTGALYVSDAEGVALQAKADALSAYTTLAQSVCTELVSVELAGATFTPGVYCSPGTFNLSAGGILTLDAEGDPDAEFIFRTGAGGTTLITGADSQVLLIGEAQPCNVYWQVGSSATIGVGTDFVGNILAEESIQLQTSATLEGRALALNGAVTLDTNTITKADCADSPTTTAPATTAPASTAPATTAPATTAGGHEGRQYHGLRHHRRRQLHEHRRRQLHQHRRRQLHQHRTHHDETGSDRVRAHHRPGSRAGGHDPRRRAAPGVPPHGEHGGETFPSPAVALPHAGSAGQVPQTGVGLAGDEEHGAGVVGEEAPVASYRTEEKQIFCCEGLAVPT